MNLYKISKIVKDQITRLLSISKLSNNLTLKRFHMTHTKSI